MNFVNLVGRLRGLLDEKTRLLEVNRPESSDTAENLFIPLRYWTLSKLCLLTAIKEGALVIIRGRIDKDDDIGFFVVVETISIVNK